MPRQHSPSPRHPLRLNLFHSIPLPNPPILTRRLFLSLHPNNPLNQSPNRLLQAILRNFLSMFSTNHIYLMFLWNKSKHKNTKQRPITSVRSPLKLKNKTYTSKWFYYNKVVLRYIFTKHISHLITPRYAYIIISKCFYK